MSERIKGVVETRSRVGGCVRGCRRDGACDREDVSVIMSEQG
jgi:hypothetical protein